MATPLHRAIREGDIGYAKDLLVNGDADTVHTTIGRGVSPLHLAAAVDNVEAAAMCLQHGADVNAVTEGGFTPLHWAASRDSERCAKFLVAHGADLNARSSKGITPLHWAANRNATNVLQFLIRSGGDIHQETENGSTPLHWAVMPDSNSMAAQMLAYEIISPLVEFEYTNRLQAVHSEKTRNTEAAKQAQAAVKTDPGPEVYVERDRARSRQKLVINIGLGQNLEFEWIEGVRLWVGKYEITNEQFRRFKARHDSLFRQNFSLNDPTQPAVRVTWNEAEAYCEWLNRTYKDRVPKAFTFRLPSVLEWMKIARCGDNRIYPWGRSWPPLYGNYSDLTAREQLVDWRGIEGYDDGQVVSCDVHLSGENEWGLFGIGGNVWEWCQDWFDTEHKYKTRAGGSWDFDQKENLRIDAIGFDRPDARYDTIGFRAVISMQATEYHLRPDQN
ncbi:MAG: SUMF1/EgtB/PvdO family nonheme iron enzyme [Verrucomicrobia bacterium]|nr:SUMF1/EgtB/PvdO family nonheme iron enzyme [Verrucomicrobiota bacterium]